jgi:hypothetical protein
MNVVGDPSSSMLLHAAGTQHAGYARGISARTELTYALRCLRRVFARAPAWLLVNLLNWCPRVIPCAEPLFSAAVGEGSSFS